MLYTAIDFHKRYSVACTMDAMGSRVKEAHIENCEQAFAAYFQGLSDDSRVVIEACRNWSWLHDILEELEGVERVVLANPVKTRIIADAQIKTDRLDAAALCTLLRGQLVAEAHVPSRSTRAKKYFLRQRQFWVRTRTALRNRIHIILDRQHGLQRPECSDIFGQKGLRWMHQLDLPHPDGALLAESLALHDMLAKQIRALEKQIAKEQASEPTAGLLRTLPGVGPVLSAIIATEIDGVERFHRSDKLCAYAGLVPSTYASGGNVYHGRLLRGCNRWLRWAFIEAAWAAIGCSGYFGGIYREHRARGKRASIAITAVARRMCQIAWSMLRENRNYSHTPRSIRSSPTAPAPI